MNKNIKPLHLTTEISHIELVEAEQKTEEKKEIVLENKPVFSKKSNMVDKFLSHVWYTRPVSDEGDLPDEIQTEKNIDDLTEKKIVAPDIDTSHSTHIENVVDDDSEIIEENYSASDTSWFNNQVYGDKVSIVLSATLPSLVFYEEFPIYMLWSKLEFGQI